jgi:hypothetical protein
MNFAAPDKIGQKMCPSSSRVKVNKHFLAAEIIPESRRPPKGGFGHPKSANWHRQSLLIISVPLL